MNWLTNLVKPKIQALVNKKNDIPDTMWHKCPGCEKMLFHRDLQDNLRVCQHCGHHMRLDAKQRLELLFDGGRSDNICDWRSYWWHTLVLKADDGGLSF